MVMRFGHEAAASERRTPVWLGPLLGVEFFKPCEAHPYLVKNECNHYCLECAGEDDAVCCTMCVSAHRQHHVIQIRKSSYREVIRVAELKVVVDVSQVQTYIINRNRVVFLNRRPQAPQHDVKCVGPAGTCRECGWGLLDANFHFCSLSCKLDGMVSDPNLTFIVDPRLNREDLYLEIEEEDKGDNYLPGPSNRQPGWISYRRRPGRVSLNGHSSIDLGYFGWLSPISTRFYFCITTFVITKNIIFYLSWRWVKTDVPIGSIMVR